MPTRPAKPMIEEEFGQPTPADQPKPASDAAAPASDPRLPKRGQRNPKT